MEINDIFDKIYKYSSLHNEYSQQKTTNYKKEGSIILSGSLKYSPKYGECLKTEYVIFKW